MGQVQPIGQMTADGCHAKEADRRHGEGQDASNRGSRIDRGAEISSSGGVQARRIAGAYIGIHEVRGQR
jgi:hypothetical protein